MGCIEFVSKEEESPQARRFSLFGHSHDTSTLTMAWDFAEDGGAYTLDQMAEGCAFFPTIWVRNLEGCHD